MLTDADTYRMELRSSLFIIKYIIHYYIQYVAKSIATCKNSLYNQPKPYFFKILL